MLVDGLRAITAVLLVLAVFAIATLTKPGPGDYGWVIGE